MANGYEQERDSRIPHEWRYKKHGWYLVKEPHKDFGKATSVRYWTGQLWVSNKGHEWDNPREFINKDGEVLMIFSKMEEETKPEFKKLRSFRGFVSVILKKYSSQSICAQTALEKIQTRLKWCDKEDLKQIEGVEDE